MTELQVDESTAAYVRARARSAGVTEREWLARHFRAAALRDAAAAHAAWYAERPGLLEDEILHAQTANTEADVA